MATYVVAKTGNDNNPGSEASPKLTVAAGLALLTQPGDVLLIRGGTYNEFDLSFPASGLPEAPISVRNYPGEPATVDGGLRAADSPGGRRQVFTIDGRHHIHFIGDEDRNFKILGGRVAHFWIGENADVNGFLIDQVDLGEIADDGDNTAPLYFNTGVNGPIVRRCWIHPENTENSGACVLFFQGDNTGIVEHCELYNGFSGLYYKHGTQQDPEGPSPIWRYNLAHDLEGRAYHGSTDNLIILGNVAYDVAGYAIKLGENAGSAHGRNNQVRHNTFIRCAGGIYLDAPEDDASPGAVDAQVFDNLLWDCSEGDPRAFGIWPFASSGTPGTLHDYNLYGDPDTNTHWRRLNVSYSSLATWQSASGQDAHALVGTPVFVDAESHNYRLAEGSPGKGAASDGSDIGADWNLVGPTPMGPVEPPYAPPPGGLRVIGLGRAFRASLGRYGMRRG